MVRKAGLLKEHHLDTGPTAGLGSCESTVSSPRQYMVISLNSSVVSLKYWIIQPRGPRVNHNQDAAVTLIISYKPYVRIVFVARFIALSQPHMHSFVLAPGPTRADHCNSHDSWLAEDTSALAWGDKASVWPVLIPSDPSVLFYT